MCCPPACRQFKIRVMSFTEPRDTYLRDKTPGVVFLFVPWCERCQRHAEVWKRSLPSIAELHCDVNFLNTYLDPDALEVFHVTEYPAVFVKSSRGSWRQLSDTMLEDIAAGRRDLMDALRASFS